MQISIDDFPRHVNIGMIQKVNEGHQVNSWFVDSGKTSCAYLSKPADEVFLRDDFWSENVRVFLKYALCMLP